MLGSMLGLGLGSGSGLGLGQGGLIVPAGGVELEPNGIRIDIALAPV